MSIEKSERGFIQVPAFETGGTSLREELHKFRVITQRREKTLLGVYLTVFLFTLFTLEGLQPNLPRNFVLSFILGLCAGVLAAFIREGSDATIKGRDMLARVLPIPLLGIAPVINKQAGSYAFQSAKYPDSAVAAAFRALHNNLLLVTQQSQPKVINITSTDASEGKSSTSINLATQYAQAGTKVLLIDADLRRPTLHKHFGCDNTKGLGNYLAGMENTLDGLIRKTFIPNLHIISSGPITPHAVELLSSERLSQLITNAEQGNVDFDLVIIDSPPVMGMADALLIGNRVHATLLVVACNETRRRPLHAAYERLKQSRTNMIGVVMTKVR
ncbi:polysaccharide biosynthesis tyrosine autokinase [Thiothrix fructosivorans]|jgi:capsular exopolysaccharide synthesis family protein|uniref:Polysaccharide biosynthesis tyrosine autokinase n=1 Tax=Thiothrix fructosivorans TaxID=111770 RepID=A0A8B0SHE6_9GAMM|nr:CpsD/CapB family tyrosine-protein kinase [Thiothrix fructosivorans]MBO0614695.1 polysaccharide biosynthesis tyrosine autokinase [Thiothrix fructosivorans]QTX09518.1 polysaccharide biosynthesis tyrosine autokinase [Thiothrix fructosivorans]